MNSSKSSEGEAGSAYTVSRIHPCIMGGMASSERSSDCAGEAGAIGGAYRPPGPVPDDGDGSVLPLHATPAISAAVAQRARAAVPAATVLTTLEPGPPVLACFIRHHPCRRIATGIRPLAPLCAPSCTHPAPVGRPLS